MAVIEKMISGEECECYEVGNTGKLRLQLEGTFGEGIERESLLLVPSSISEQELDEVLDFWLTEQEFELGLPLGESCTSSGFWVGSKDDSKDMNITKDYDAIIEHVMALSLDSDSLDAKIHAAKNKFFHDSQEAKLLFWIGAEFEYNVNLSLCGRVYMENKNDEDLIFTYSTIQDALVDWKKELLDDPEEYKEEIAFIEKLGSFEKQDMNKSMDMEL